MVKLIVLLNLLFFINLSMCRQACKDEYNNDVDWFIALKYPKSYQFVYLNNNSFSQWNAPKYNLSNSNNFIGLTISQTSSSIQSNSFYSFYNDENPDEKLPKDDEERGHLKAILPLLMGSINNRKTGIKYGINCRGLNCFGFIVKAAGVLSFNTNDGFWLIHSVPKFPTFGKYYYGEGQTIYGQSFVCISMKTTDLNSIVRQMLIMESTVYSSYIPENFTTDTNFLNYMYEFVNNKHVEKSDSYQIFRPQTPPSFPALHFAKSQVFDKDLYDSLVAPTLRSDILVESWIRGKKVYSTCDTTYKVYNIQKVSLADTTYPEFDDHSKWVVSNKQSTPFVCIGDINRMTSQFKRGGGTLCIRNKPVWMIFNALVNKYEKCDNMELLHRVLPEWNL